ncbi:hypothetical protein TRIUR3_24677 [Triticum urartu]|uniref:Uncharacterized protein n=1 Tax=Triticum urartu TaxID=4572 RepID=M7Z6Y6_TRIUA|nr:hypothetical protein TRIUR3_24677 [Triticum urartu]
MARHSDDEARDREEAKGPGGGDRLQGGRGGRQRCRRGGVQRQSSMGGAAMHDGRAGGSRGLGCGVQRRQRRDSGAWQEEERRKEIGKRRLVALGDRRKRRGIEQVLLARCVR